MPVIIPPESYNLWLDRNNKDIKQLKDILKPYPEELMTAYTVSSLVNSYKNDVPA